MSAREGPTAGGVQPAPCAGEPVATVGSGVVDAAPGADGDVGSAEGWGGADEVGAAAEDSTGRASAGCGR